MQLFDGAYAFPLTLEHDSEELTFTPGGVETDPDTVEDIYADAD